MNLILIKSSNRLINLDQITHAEFYPARDYIYTSDENFDDQGNGIAKQLHDDACLILVMTSVTDKVNSGFEGEFEGMTSVSREIRIKGKDAEDTWFFLMCQSIKII